MRVNQIYKSLGIRIRDLRKSLGRTQDQLAKQVGISRASLANIEAGRQQVLVHHLIELASALDLESPAALLLPSETNSRPSRVESQLPLPGEGLTDKQRREILSLIDGTLTSDGGIKEREDT